FDCNKNGSSIDIITLDGRIIKSLTNLYNGDKINVADVSKGVYFVKVTDSTSRMEVIKMVKN
ncbi:MAG TPA: T9SS type A sorting domain-containing protein, partial [Saprospiraceae bacterium]|nr:T9SS type A sorting domain-containing protein [Saprospiraceae bacterium]